MAFSQLGGKNFRLCVIPQQKNWQDLQNRCHNLFYRLQNRCHKNIAMMSCMLFALFLWICRCFHGSDVNWHCCSLYKANNFIHTQSIVCRWNSTFSLSFCYNRSKNISYMWNIKRGNSKFITMRTNGRQFSCNTYTNRFMYVYMFDYLLVMYFPVLYIRYWNSPSTLYNLERNIS